MSDDNENIDPFDDIVNNQPEDDDSDQELENIWEAMAHVWPHFYPGILVKGVILAEYIDPDGSKVMRFITSPDVTPWELLGLLESARLDAREISCDATIADPLRDSDDEDE